MPRFATAVTLLLALLGAGAAATPSPPPSVISLQVEPARITLVGPRAEGRLVVTARLSSGVAVDVTPMARITSSNPRVADVDPGRVSHPISDGQASLVVAYGGRSVSVPVSVKDARKAAPIEFTREVVPIFTHAGCNQGSCHGSQYGKGGFKLSLAGTEPDVDYAALLKQAGGRRAYLFDPPQSLMLRKPTLAVAHMGGKRLEVGSIDYRLLLQWLADGAPGPTPKDPEVTRLDVFPSQRVMGKGGRQSLAIWATYSDGVVRDVTRWARLNALNEAVASVSADAVVRANGSGETGVMVRFGGQAALARVTVPFAQVARYPAFPSSNFVDDLVQRKWRSLGLLPSGPCDDATFMRRLYLDVIGTPPTAEEVRALLADTSSDKRTRLIDRVLDRPEYADYWTVKWADLLRSERGKLGPKGMWSFTNWIRAQLRENRPADQFCRDLITAQGSTFTNGPANYYRVVSSPPDLAETTAQVFLGTRLQCTRCHHHPYERWSQQDYYQFAAFFARVGIKGSNEFGIFGNEQVVRLNDGGEVTHPKTGKVMKPTPLGGYPDSMKVHAPKTADLVDPDPDAGGDRRALLADWITRDNPLFARNIVNRYWGYLMGRGLVEPIDDQRVTNPPTNPELLDALAKDFAAHGYDIKRLIRTICASRVYQLSASVTKQNQADSTFYTHYLVKRLPAEVLLDAVNAATGTQEKFGGLPAGFRAIQLPDPQVDSYFLDAFGRAPRAIACECERSAEPNVGQALDLMMGDVVNRKVQDQNGLLGKLIAAKKSETEILQTLYLAALGRPPRQEETARALGAIHGQMERPAFLPKQSVRFVPVQLRVGRTAAAKAADRTAVLQDILWALLNSREFVFNH